MDCTRCENKECRKGEKCKVVSFNSENVISKYSKQQLIVYAAAQLVDNGRAGTLSRLNETIEFSKMMNYKTIGLAYCYGMESEVKLIANIFRAHGFKVEAASCTVGGLTQNQVNLKSENCNVSCNPIGQAQQLNKQLPDLTITIGLCLGHDILFNREIESDTTNLITKDRVHDHKPIEAIRSI